MEQAAIVEFADTVNPQETQMPTKVPDTQAPDQEQPQEYALIHVALQFVMLLQQYYKQQFYETLCLFTDIYFS